MKWIIAVFIIAFSLTSVWFSNGKMLARAEEGLPFYNSSRTFHIYKYLWQDSNFGSVNPFLVSRLPLYKFVSWFQSQQLIFFILLITPLISFPYLVKLLLPNTFGSTGKYAALFYFFNLFALTQVWYRFIYPLIFLWSYLPMFLFLWFKWLKTSQKKYLFYFILSSFVFSDAYGLTSSVFALWIPAGILWLKNRQIIPAVVATILWLATNVWWWYPLVVIKDNPYKNLLDSAQNIISLVDVSKYYPSSDIILLKQKYYFSSQTIWFNFFSNPYITYLSWIFPILLAVGLIWIVKSKSGRLVIIWLVVSWVFVNGANSQFGMKFYEWLFKLFPPAMVLRNPYEKLGAMFLLPYCLIMAVGISKIPFRILRTLIIFVVCFVLLSPMWTGQVFSGYQVDVPVSYLQANNFLNSQSNLRLLQLPFLQGAGTSYIWGYSGEEPSSFLFDRPSLSGTYFSPTDPYLFLYKHLRSPKVYKLLQLFAVDTIVLHKDALPNPAYQENYEGSRALLSGIENIKLTKTFADLDIYQLDSSFKTGWGYLSNRVFSVPTLADGFSLVVKDDLFNPQSDSFIISSELSPKIFSENLPNYTITKLSPVRYIYHIKQAAKPYLLVLSQNFNSGWKATIDKIELKDHISINGFANGWLIEKKGNYDIDIMFKTWPWE